MSTQSRYLQISVYHRGTKKQNIHNSMLFILGAFQQWMEFCLSDGMLFGAQRHSYNFSRAFITVILTFLWQNLLCMSRPVESLPRGFCSLSEKDLESNTKWSHLAREYMAVRGTHILYRRHLCRFNTTPDGKFQTSLWQFMLLGTSIELQSRPLL